MNKIGIYGGSFNPVHIGHLRLMDASIKELQLDKLIVVPCYIQPFKMDVKEDNSKERLDMLNMSILNPKIEVSSFEIDEGDVSYTEETLAHFKTIYPDSEIIFIVGTDSFLKLDTWKNGEFLLKNYSFAVANRPGYDKELLENCIRIFKEKFNTTVYVIHEEMPYISSSEIREKISLNLSTDDLITLKVNKYITENGLYKA